MPSLPENINTDITPKEFELLVHQFLDSVGRTLLNFNSKHDVRILRDGGEYQIDIFAEFEALGATIKVLVECKRYKRKVEREVVQLLFDKLRSVGANKGMIFSSSGFQTGARQFAEIHGIALIHVIEGRLTYVTKSGGEQQYDPPPWADIPKYVGEFKWENTITYLQDGYFDDLENFLFGDHNNN